MSILNEILQTPQIDALRLLSSLAIPILGITLKKASTIKATILANNLPKDELIQLMDDANSALVHQRNAANGFCELTPQIMENASLAQLVLTKIQGAVRRREKKPQRPKRRINYM